MKIILLANTSWYLYNYALPLATALRQRGHQVVLLCPPGPYIPLLETAGFRVLSLPLKRRGIGLFSEWQTLSHLKKIYRREQPDLVHHFTLKCLIYGSLAARSAHIPAVVNSVTGLGYSFSGQKLDQRLLQVLIRLIARPALAGTFVLFQNPDDLDDFVRRGLVQSQRTTLIRGSGVDLDRFAVRPEPPGTPLVLLAARMLYEKGVVEFVEAARTLRASQVAARFILVGQPDIHNPASVPAETLQKWNDEGVVEWWGWQDDMAPIYRQVHIVCLPSYYREGVPKSLIEAAASGIPIVTTDTHGCREVVQHGLNGLLVAPRSVPQLAQALQLLIQDAPLRQRMGLAGRTLAEEQFKLQDVLAATLAVYGIGAT